MVRRDAEASEDKKLFLFAGTQLLHATGALDLPQGVPDGMCVCVFVYVFVCVCVCVCYWRT